MVETIWSRTPETMVAIAMTVETPMTTPRMVRPERPFAAARESTAETTFSLNWSPIRKKERILLLLGARGSLDSPFRLARDDIYSALIAAIGSSFAARDAG